MTADPAAIVQSFERRYGRLPRVFHAPGRVNLIGEHTDYHDGLVLPMAIERGTLVAAAARDDRALRVYSANLETDGLVDLREATAPRRGGWLDYVEGTARLLEERVGRLRGADLWIEGDVPVGAGLSSSASLEVALALALLALADRHAAPIDVARACQAAEHRHAGTQCGIMDPLTAALGQADHALLIDCRSLDTTPIRLPDGVAVVVCDSGVRHRLAASAYNERRAESTEALRQLADGRPDRLSLRDVSTDSIAREGGALTKRLLSRARHVVSEIERTRSAAEALARGDLTLFGRLMIESHRSLRDDYEVSAPGWTHWWRPRSPCPASTDRASRAAGSAGARSRWRLRRPCPGWRVPRERAAGAIRPHTLLVRHPRRLWRARGPAARR